MQPIKVLILEDDANTVLLFSTFLAELDGVEVIGSARDGVSGLERIRRERPDLVLLDLVMPKMGGMEVLKALSLEQMERRPRILVLSGIHDDQMVQNALKLGANDYIMKPVSLEILADRIHYMFRQKSVDGQPYHAMAAWYLNRMDAPDCLGMKYTRIVCGTLAELGEGALLKEGYAEVVRIHKVTVGSVERDIRRFIGKLHAAESPGYVDFMGETREARPPKNRDFLMRLAEKIRSK